MKRNTALLLAYLLAGSPGTLLLAKVANAVPNHQDRSFDAPEWTSGHYTRKPYSRIGIPELNSATREDAQQHDIVPSGSAACRYDLAGEGPVYHGTGSNKCSNSFAIQQRLSVRLGRRIGARDDILGELDGIRVDYRLSDGFKLNGIAGYPVNSPEDRFNPAQQVFGFSTSTNTFAQAWDLNGFILEQQENGTAESSSMGGVIRYLQPQQSLLVYLDYNVADNAAGTATLSGALKLPSGSTFSATFDRRNRRIPVMQLKYLQLTTATLEGWSLLLPEDRLARHTPDGTGEVSTLAFGLSHTLSRHMRLGGDLSVLEPGDSANVDTVNKDLPREYIYHTRLAGRDLVLAGDRSNLDVRYSKTQAGRISSIALDSRYAVTRFWSITPVLRYDYRSAGPGPASLRVFAPSLKMEFRRNNQSGLQIEASGSWTSGNDPEIDDSGAPCFVSLAYQALF